MLIIGYYVKKEHHSFKDDSKIFDSMRASTIKCKKCNKSVLIVKQDRAICPDCGHWVYKTDELEFKYRIKEVMIKNGK